jgi:polyisoprenoid-binding protein YceI
VDSPTERGNTDWMTLKRLVTRLLVGVLALATLVVGGAWVYATFINDAPEEFGVADLENRLSETTTTAESTTAESSTSALPPSTLGTNSEDDATSETATTAPAQDPRQEWTIAEGSEVGYRVAEVLFGIDTEGVGRTESVTGSITIDGTSILSAEFTVDVESMRSDDGRRDGQFRGRIMETNEFPTASFALTQPIDLGVSATEGATVATTISGELTMHGVTNPVSFDISAKVEGGRLGVIGSIPVVFTDYDILDPSISGIKVEPEGLIEFVLIFSQQ